MTSQEFGGGWTKIKLEMVQKYLDAYTIALKNQPFTLWYIDGFAGTGSYEPKLPKQPVLKGFGLFDEKVVGESCKDGSARIALQLRHPFDQYVFIEKDPNRYKELKKLRDDFPELANRITFKNKDANSYVASLCKQINWKRNRAVMFLDPFGCQVDWETIECIAKTRAIDLWFLFPLSGVNRMLKRSGEMDQSWSNKLDRVFGNDDWYQAFYSVGKRRTLFGGDQEFIKKSGGYAEIREYILNRLSEVFAGVSDNSPILYQQGRPLFLLCFAVGNERGKDLALKFAKHIIKSTKWR